MSIEENKALMRRIFEEIVNRKNLALVDEFFTANYVFHVTGFEDLRGPEGMKQYFTTTFTAFPDYHVTIEDMVGEGDKVVARLAATGTHKGDFVGIAPTDRQVTFTFIVIGRIVGGKFVEAWQEVDSLGLMQQLGAIPSQ